MTKDELCKIAFKFVVGGLEFDEDGLMLFYKEIRAATKEEDAKICEGAVSKDGPMRLLGIAFAQTIRDSKDAK